MSVRKCFFDDQRTLELAPIYSKAPKCLPGDSVDIATGSIDDALTVFVFLGELHRTNPFLQDRVWSLALGFLDTAIPAFQIGGLIWTAAYWEDRLEYTTGIESIEFCTWLLPWTRRRCILLWRWRTNVWR